MGLSTLCRTPKMSYVSPTLDGGGVQPTIVKPSAHQSRSKVNGLAKYFAQRHRLFHRFDQGIQLDEESWYSVTPEKIAAHIAERFDGKEVVVDLFSGAGGNSIQFALAGAHVIGIEISVERIGLAKNNARVYGVEQYIEFINADVFAMLPVLAARKPMISAMFMSPPWGGPGYKEQKVFDVSVFAKLLALAKCVTEDVAILIPRNIELENVLKNFGPCEVEQNFLGGKKKTVTVYCGSLVGNSRTASL